MAKIDLSTGGIFDGPCILHPLEYPWYVVYLYIRPHLPSISSRYTNPSQPITPAHEAPLNFANFFGKIVQLWLVYPVHKSIAAP